MPTAKRRPPHNGIIMFYGIPADQIYCAIRYQFTIWMFVAYGIKSALTDWTQIIVGEGPQIARILPTLLFP